MVGILVHGNNHFILSGPAPDEAFALALARHWSIVQIGETKSPSFGQWEIRSEEFRENLEWAVIVRSLAPSQRAVFHRPNECWTLTKPAPRGSVATRSAVLPTGLATFSAHPSS